MKLYLLVVLALSTLSSEPVLNNQPASAPKQVSQIREKRKKLLVIYKKRQTDIEDEIRAVQNNINDTKEQNRVKRAKMVVFKKREADPEEHLNRDKRAKIVVFKKREAKIQDQLNRVKRAIVVLKRDANQTPLRSKN